jgi:hypothetical protein
MLPIESLVSHCHAERAVHRTTSNAGRALSQIARACVKQCVDQGREGNTHCQSIDAIISDWVANGLRLHSRFKGEGLRATRSNRQLTIQSDCFCHVDCSQNSSSTNAFVFDSSSSPICDANTVSSRIGRPMSEPHSSVSPHGALANSNVKWFGWLEMQKQRWIKHSVTEQILREFFGFRLYSSSARQHASVSRRGDRLRL